MDKEIPSSDIIKNLSHYMSVFESVLEKATNIEDSSFEAGFLAGQSFALCWILEGYEEAMTMLKATKEGEKGHIEYEE